MDIESYLHAKLGNDAKCPMKEVGTIKFQLELGGMLEAKVMLFILGLKKNFLLVSIMEDKGFEVRFRNKKVFVHLEKSIP